MRRLSSPLGLLLVMGGAVLLVVAPVIAFATVHNGTLNGDEAQAATCSAGSTSQILGTVTYDDVSGLFSWNYNYGDNSPVFNDGGLFGGGSETISHFHGPAMPGSGAGVQVGVSTGNPNSGSATISASQGADLLNELWYLNVHSSTCAGGELRAQALFGAAVPSYSAPMIMGLLALIMGTAMFALKRARA